MPPTREKTTGDLQIAEAGWAKEFDLSAIAEVEVRGLEEASRADDDDFIAIPAGRR